MNLSNVMMLLHNHELVEFRVAHNLGHNLDTHVFITSSPAYELCKVIAQSGHEDAREACMYLLNTYAGRYKLSADLARALNWGESPQGHEFWSGIRAAIRKAKEA